MANTNSFRTLLYKFINEYADELIIARANEDFKRPLGALVRQDIAGVIQSRIDNSIYKVKGSVGAGKWTDVPWIAVFDKRITTSAQKGVYIVYLLNKDTKELFLTLNQGATEVEQEELTATGRKLSFTGIATSSSDKSTANLKNRANNIRAILRDKIDLPTGEIVTGSKAYDAGSIYYIRYSLNNLPGDEELFSDLVRFIDAYSLYYDVFLKKENAQVYIEELVEEGEEELSTKETLASIKSYITAKGFTFDDGLVENYYLSLKSKPFVILAGTSGTGKTRLVRLFAEAIGATSQNGRYKLVSVRPDWSDSSDLFGHVNLNDKFVPGEIIDFVKQAELDSKNPYFLCLDEMNLARVEYYLSDILSIIETREYVDGKVVTDPLINENYYGADTVARGKYGVVRIPDNLYIVGTVNMDETTFPFSRKVLDRANTIEFSTVELLADFGSAHEEAKSIYADNSFMKADYVFFNQCAPDQNFVEEICIELQDINKILEKASAHVGYRVRDEIVFYMLNNKNAGNLLTRDRAFDNEIMQKILPRIQGSSASVKAMLCELFKHCAGDYESYQTESDEVSSKMMAAANKDTCKYKESAKKIAFMVRRFEEDGFTAYWL